MVQDSLSFFNLNIFAQTMGAFSEYQRLDNLVIVVIAIRFKTRPLFHSITHYL